MLFFFFSVLLFLIKYLILNIFIESFTISLQHWTRKTVCQCVFLYSSTSLRYLQDNRNAQIADERHIQCATIVFFDTDDNETKFVWTLDVSRDTCAVCHRWLMSVHTQCAYIVRQRGSCLTQLEVDPRWYNVGLYDPSRCLSNKDPDFLAPRVDYLRTI